MPEKRKRDQHPHIVIPDKRRSRADPGSIEKAAPWIPALASGSAGMTRSPRFMGLNARKKDPTEMQRPNLTSDICHLTFAWARSCAKRMGRQSRIAWGGGLRLVLGSDDTCFRSARALPGSCKETGRKERARNKLNQGGLL